MLVALIVLLVVNLTIAKPQFFSNAVDAVVTTHDNFINELGEYAYNIETSDGQLRYETRRVFNPGTDQERAVVEGFYTYLDPNGERKSVGYRADENGFYAEGEHLPGSASTRRKPPEVGIPPNCVQSLCAGNSLG